jgi:purine-binding chemotaxis protein CheW
MEATEEEFSEERNLSGRYLTFDLGGNRYGIQILQVQEILGTTNVTRVPLSSNAIRGVMNLRGKVVPVLDARTLLQLPSKKDDERTCCIVMTSESDGEELVAGVIVDCVDEVVTFAPSDIKVSHSAKNQQQEIMGVGKLGNSIVLLLDAALVMARSVKRGKKNKEEHE